MKPSQQRPPPEKLAPLLSQNFRSATSDTLKAPLFTIAQSSLEEDPSPAFLSITHTPIHLSSKKQSK